MSIHRYDDGNFFPGSGAPDEVSGDPPARKFLVYFKIKQMLVFEETLLLSNCVSNIWARWKNIKP